MTLSQLRNRVRYWTRIMGLRHWRFSVGIVEGFSDSPNSEARCEASNIYDTADLDFKRSFLDHAEEDELDITIVHELLHVVMRDFDETVERIDEQLSPAVSDLWQASLKHEREGVVDRLSKLIVALHSN